MGVTDGFIVAMRAKAYQRLREGDVILVEHRSLGNVYRCEVHYMASVRYHEWQMVATPDAEHPEMPPWQRGHLDLYGYDADYATYVKPEVLEREPRMDEWALRDQYMSIEDEKGRADFLMYQTGGGGTIGLRSEDYPKEEPHLRLCHGVEPERLQKYDPIHFEYDTAYRCPVCGMRTGWRAMSNWAIRAWNAEEVYKDEESEQLTLF